MGHKFLDWNSVGRELCVACLDQRSQRGQWNYYGDLGQRRYRTLEVGSGQDSSSQDSAGQGSSGRLQNQAQGRIRQARDQLVYGDQGGPTYYRKEVPSIEEAPSKMQGKRQRNYRYRMRLHRIELSVVLVSC